jgi:glutamate dehydrogenase
MPRTLEENRKEIIERVVVYVLEKIPKDEAPLLEAFIRQYYWSVSPEDLVSRGLFDLYGAVVSHWHHIYQRKPNETKVRVYNPQFEKHGWQSAHTVIEIVCNEMPFLVDSISMELNRMDLNIHLIISIDGLKVKRDSEGRVLEIYPPESTETDYVKESPVYIEIDRQSDPSVLENITHRIEKVLSDVSLVVTDWQEMRQQVLSMIEYLKHGKIPTPSDELKESIAFLEWLVNDHFTFIGCQDYHLVGEGDDKSFQTDPKSGLGIFKQAACDAPRHRKMSDLPIAARKLIFSDRVLILGKTSTLSTIHRPVFTDFVAVKLFDGDGKFIGEKRFIGLYTSAAYNASPKHIPLLRRKIETVLNNAGFPEKSHDGKNLVHILETLPRDDLFHASEEELYDLAIGILYLQERLRIRLFVRRDTYGRFFSCLVFVPREKFNSELREKMQKVLLEAFKGIEVSFSTRFSESVLARIHFVVRVPTGIDIEYDISDIEKKLIEAARTWRDELQSALVEHTGEERGNDLFKQYGDGFPAGYQETFSPRTAVIDIEYMEKLDEKAQMTMSLYRPIEDPEDTLRFKLFYTGITLPLSDVVPMLENMGLRIISERPYAVSSKNRTSIWINDYRMIHPKGKALDIDAIKEIFQETFYRVWHGFIENDGFNRLVLEAHLNWREITVFRGYAKYLWQTGFTFSQNSLEDTLYTNPMITRALMQLFSDRFNLEHPATEEQLVDQKIQIEQALESVANLNEDRILRRYLETILATIRTNYYQQDENKQHKPYFSFKLESAKVPELPLPHPLFEIFVYSPLVEGIHMRGAKVARGGIRWSERREDFRTEVLGLMKAQQVKNAVIVPLGAKGGFVVKRQSTLTREQLMEEVVTCYKIFIRGLLDLTDNLRGDTVVPPTDVVRYDEDDPYLVVAADKGTATFSDIANGISKEYNFWLQDAFASGGSAGYDHKKMGITARGAWESVKRHFKELGRDTQTEDFTIVGIGDMAGDVFGNGMLLSRHIKLVAAFNHQHIFIDPNPDPEKSFLERKRLFELPRSSWADYNPDLLSKGAGIYPRSAKLITLSDEACAALGIENNKMVPNELIKALLRAPVDLLWNGGIGTYVKASFETHLEVGDRSNDALRISANELRCKVVGEGGNLGFTQMARIEYSKQGGHCNTDAIDNSAGVNCSDNEVNIKILLNDVVLKGDMTEKQRNQLLIEMEAEVAELVLNNNRQQTEAISVAVFQAPESLDMHGRLLQEMERNGDIDRTIEFLPSNEELSVRKAAGLGLTRPEIAVLMAYAKNLLKKSLLASTVLEDSFVYDVLGKAFPTAIQTRFHAYLDRHRLKREIIATQISNALINEMGISFVSRLQDETGAPPAEIVRAYIVARQLFGMDHVRHLMNAPEVKIDAKTQLMILQEANRLVRRGTRWFIRNRRAGMNIAETITHFQPLINQVRDIIPNLLVGTARETCEALGAYLENAGIPKDCELMRQAVIMGIMHSSLDIVETAITHHLDISMVVSVYFSVGDKLELSWFREQIKNRPVNNHWEALARAAFRDDVDRQQSLLTVSIINFGESEATKSGPSDKLVEKWLKRHKRLISRWQFFVNELKTVATPEFTMFSVVLRELLDMGQTMLHLSNRAQRSNGSSGK